MGLKTDLIDAKIEGLRLSGATDEAILQAQDAIETQCQLEEDAIVNFLTECEFRITQLNAPVVLEDFKIPPQQGDVLPSVTVTTSGGPGTVSAGTNGVLTKTIDVGKTSGLLQSTGYTFIGEDPDEQGAFSVNDESGQRDFTTVKLFRADIEDLLG
jgi:hypothetical protein